MQRKPCKLKARLSLHSEQLTEIVKNSIIIKYDRIRKMQDYKDINE